MTNSRREFLRDIARAGLATGLAALGALLLGRSRLASACTPSAQCQGCGVYRICPSRRAEGKRP